ncbi:50S ribosomal protein L32 [Candidatus Saganbacteria bacterium]|nr:50S ribosomal protein L32 [Candidatus Saganbacteria bacterium]
MPVPKKRHSNSRQGKRRATNYKLTAATLSRCPQCGATTLPHHACHACGTYKGRQVLKIKVKKPKKEQP